MTENPRRPYVILALVVVAILIAFLLLRCSRAEPAVPEREVDLAPPAPALATPQAATTPTPAAAEPDELLTAATLQVPERVTAGAVFSVAWTGPDNRGDHVTIVVPDAVANAFGDYEDTKTGSTLELTAPVDPGAYEVRYVTGRSRTILARAAIEVAPAEVTLDAAAEVVLGASLSVAWTGPDNTGDYVTIVPKELPDGQYGSYTDTSKGSPLTVTAPPVAGDAELRYMTGPGRKVLARRPVRVVLPEISMSAPAEAVAGSSLELTWTGPNNSGDYITVVSVETPDGQYGNYTLTSNGSPMSVLLPIMVGAAELRYMTGQGNKVLARRALAIVAAEVTLSAPDEAAADSIVTITWTGPNHHGDYITVVAKDTPDGQYASYTLTSEGSPLGVKAPKEPGEAELRYMTGQGNKVLARRPIRIVP